MSANVRDIDVIKDFRAALVKFAEAAQVSLTDADSDVLRTLHWLEMEMVPYWTTQIRKREELVSRCKDAVRQKTMYKDATGRPQSAIDEMKQLKKAQALLEEAQQKWTASKAYVRRIQHAQMEYRGQTQKLGLTLTTEVPNTVAKLGNLLNLLDQYAAPASLGEVGSMAVAPEEPKPAEKPKENVEGG
ncbi:MAG: hypothetical protein QM770_09275 [Tepidisphaeraceae bacterium]